MIEQLQHEYEKKIKQLETRVERQKIHIEALQLSLKVKKQAIATLKKQLPTADLFKATKYDCMQAKNSIERALQHLDIWQESVNGDNSL